MKVFGKYLIVDFLSENKNILINVNAAQSFKALDSNNEKSLILYNIAFFGFNMVLHIKEFLHGNISICHIHMYIFY